jgi:hypothetical protein
MSQKSDRDLIKEDLFLLSFCDRKYINGFKTIWRPMFARKDLTVYEIVNTISEPNLKYVRRQIDNALKVGL